MAAKPVVLLRHVRQRALPGQRQRRHAVGLVALLVDEVDATRRASIWCRPVPPDSQRRGDPRRQHALPRRGGRPLRRQVGHRLRRARPRAGRSRRCARRSARQARALPALARDRRGDGLLHAEHAARRADRAGHLQRHLAGHAREPRRQRRAAGAARSRRCPPTPSACRSRIESFDLVLGHAVLHHIPDLPRAFAEFERVLAPGGTLLFAGEPSRYGDRLASVPKRAAGAVAPLWRRAIGARPAPPADGGAPDAALESVVDVHAFAPAELRALRRGRRLRRRARHRRGAAGELVRLDQPHARGDRRARSTCRGPGASTPTAATCCCRSSTAGCSSRGCRRRSSTTCMIAARKPAP